MVLQADYVTVVEDRLVISAKYRLSVTFGQNLPMQQSHGLFATAMLLVNLKVTNLHRLIIRIIKYRIYVFLLCNLIQSQCVSIYCQAYLVALLIAVI